VLDGWVELKAIGGKARRRSQYPIPPHLLSAGTVDAVRMKDARDRPFIIRRASAHSTQPSPRCCPSAAGERRGHSAAVGLRFDTDEVHQYSEQKLTKLRLIPDRIDGKIMLGKVRAIGHTVQPSSLRFRHKFGRSHSGESACRRCCPSAWSAGRRYALCVLLFKVKHASDLVVGTRVWHQTLQSGGTVEAISSTDGDDHPFRVHFDEGTVHVYSADGIHKLNMMCAQPAYTKVTDPDAQLLSGALSPP
jgi:hypothetical protein